VWKVAILGYNPPLNFLASSLDKTRYVVQNQKAGFRRFPSSDFIDERKTRKGVTFLGFNFSDLITE